MKNEFVTISNCMFPITKGNLCYNWFGYSHYLLRPRFVIRNIVLSNSFNKMTDKVEPPNFQVIQTRYEGITNL